MGTLRILFLAGSITLAVSHAANAQTPAASGASITAGSATGTTATATTSSSSFVNLQSINFTTTAVSTGVGDASTSVVIGNNSGSSQTVSVRYALDGVPVGPGFVAVLPVNGVQPISFSEELSGLSAGPHQLTVQWADIAGGGSVSAYSQNLQFIAYNVIPVPEPTAVLAVSAFVSGMCWLASRRRMKIEGNGAAE